jgi:hypothetical protein
VTFALVAMMLMPCVDAHSMASGAPAPCEGVLVPTDGALACIEARRVLLPACEAQLAYTGGQLEAEMELSRLQASAHMSQAEELESLLSDALTPPSWYEGPAIAFVAGFVVASAVSIAWGVAR